MHPLCPPFNFAFMFRDGPSSKAPSFEPIGGISESTKAAENANAANKTRGQVMGAIVSDGAQGLLEGLLRFKLGLGKKVVIETINPNSTRVRWVKARRGDLCVILRQGLNETYTVTPEAA
jgi:hypothetical protein